MLNSNPPSAREAKETAEEAVQNARAPVDTAALWSVPYLRNPHFTGREAFLEQLDQKLSVARDDVAARPYYTALTQAIKGLGGIGKTQIAVEYAYRARERNHFTHILWINAASEEATMASFVAIASILPATAAQEEIDQHKLVTAIIHWLENCQERWLLIFDNADDLVFLQPYLPHRGNGSLLFTTRSHAVGSFAASLEVEKMGLVEGTMLLLQRAQRHQASDEERNEATNIVIALDGFPLALDQAGAYIEETECSFGDYLQTYRDHHQALLARRGIQTTNYPDSVATTWSLSFQQIAQTNLAAAELLKLCAFLSPDAIPEELLVQGAAHWPAALQQAAADRFAFDHLLETLLRFSLIKRRVEEHLLSLHRLVQVVQQGSMEMEEQRQWARRVVCAIHEVFPPDPKEDVACWPQCLRYLEQAQACDTLIQQYHLQSSEATELLIRVGTYLNEHASYDLARSLYQRALALWEQQGEPENSSLAIAFHGLGKLYLKQGKYEQAEQFYRRAIAIREQQLGPDHADLASPLTGLANIYFDQRKFEQAEQLYRRAITIREQWLGPDHPLVNVPLNNLADLYREQGRYKEAEALFLRALRLRKQQSEGTHPELVHPLNNLAMLYMAQGKYAQAEELLLEALQIWEQQLGVDHPQVAYPLNNLADLYRAQGKYAQAEPLYQRALSIREQQLGPEHQQTAFPLNNLADLYRAQGRYTQAELLYQRSLAIWEQQLGPEHPTVVYALNGLANLYREQGKYREAEQLYQWALHIREQCLGEQHIETAETLHDFAVLREKQEKQQAAISFYQRALAVREETLGPEHPQTVETRTRYAALVRDCPEATI